MAAVCVWFPGRVVGAFESVSLLRSSRVPHDRRSDARRAARAPRAPKAGPDGVFALLPTAFDPLLLLGDADTHPRDRVAGALATLATLSTRFELAAIGAEPTIAAARVFAAESVRSLHAIVVGASPPTRGATHAALVRVERFRTWLALREADECPPMLLLLCDTLVDLLRDATRAGGGGR